MNAMLPTIGGWFSIQTKILTLQEASEMIGNQFVEFWTQKAVVPVEVKQAQPRVDRGDGAVEKPMEMTQEHSRDAEKAGHSERPVGGRQEGGSEGPSQMPGGIFPGVQLAMPQTPPIPSLQNVSDSLTQNEWRGAFVQNATGSAPTIAADIKEPEAPIAPQIEVNVPRAPYAWYPGVLGKEKKRQYNRGSTRWLDTSWGGTGEPTAAADGRYVSVLDSMPGQLPRTPDDKQYCQLDAASWNLVEALGTPRHPHTEWHPAQLILDAARLLAGQRLEHEEQPPPSPIFLPVDTYFAPREKPSSLGLSMASNPQAPPLLDFDEDRFTHRAASPGAVRQGISTPLRAPTVTFALIEENSSSKQGAASRIHALPPPSPLFLNDETASSRISPNSQRAPFDILDPDASGISPVARSMPWYMQSGSSVGSGKWSPCVREARDAQLVPTFTKQEEDESARAKAIEEHNRRRIEAQEAITKTRNEAQRKRSAEIASARAGAGDEMARKEAEAEQLHTVMIGRRKQQAAEEMVRAGEEERKRQSLEEERVHQEEQVRRKREIDKQQKKAVDEERLATIAEKRREVEASAVAAAETATAVAQKRREDEAAEGRKKAEEAQRILEEEARTVEEERKTQEDAARKLEEEQRAAEERKRQEQVEHTRKKEEERRSKDEEQRLAREQEEIVAMERKKKAATAAEKEAAVTAAAQKRRGEEAAEEERRRRKEEARTLAAARRQLEQGERRDAAERKKKLAAEAMWEREQEREREREAALAAKKMKFNAVEAQKKKEIVALRTEDAKGAAQRAAALAARKMVHDSDDEDEVDAREKTAQYKFNADQEERRKLEAAVEVTRKHDAAVAEKKREQEEEASTRAREVAAAADAAEQEDDQLQRVTAVGVLQAACRRNKAQRTRKILMSLGRWCNAAHVPLTQYDDAESESSDEEATTHDQTRFAAAKALQAACRRYKAQGKRKILMSLGKWLNSAHVNLTQGAHSDSDSSDDEPPQAWKQARRTTKNTVPPRAWGVERESGDRVGEAEGRETNRNFAGKFWQRLEKERKEAEEKRVCEDEERAVARKLSEMRANALKRQQKREQATSAATALELKMKQHDAASPGVKKANEEEEQRKQKEREEQDKDDGERQRAWKAEEDRERQRAADKTHAKDEKGREGHKTKEEESERASEREREARQQQVMDDDVRRKLEDIRKKQEDGAALADATVAMAAATATAEGDIQKRQAPAADAAEAAAQAAETATAQAAATAAAAAEEQLLAVEASKVEEERKTHAEAVWKVEEERRAEVERKSEEERSSREEMLRKVEEERRVRKERDQQEEAAREVEDAQRAVEEREQHAQAEQLRKGDKQMEIAHELVEKQQVEDAKRVMQVAVGVYLSAGVDKTRELSALSKNIADAEQQRRAHTQAGNSAMAATRQLLSSALSSSSASSAASLSQQALAACQRAQEEYTAAGIVNTKQEDLEGIALQVQAAVADSLRRQGHVAAGDKALASSRNMLAHGDLEGSRAARTRAGLEYETGNEDRKLVLRELDHDVRDATEKKEMEERLARAAKQKAEEEERHKKEAADQVRNNTEGIRRKIEVELRARKTEEMQRQREEEERTRHEEEDRIQREEEERETREEEEARRKAAENVKAGDAHMDTARAKNGVHDFDGARAARQIATECYVKAGQEKYDELKRLDVEIDAAVKKKEQAEFFESAKKKAFAQATAAQAKWKDVEDAVKSAAILPIQAALRRARVQRTRKLSVALGNWSSFSESTPRASVHVPRLNIRLPPPSPSKSSSTPQDEEERARRARERRLQFLEIGGGVSMLGDLRSALHLPSTRQPAASPRAPRPPPHNTSAEVEAERAKRAQERRNQFMAMQGGDALSQLQATLTSSAGSSPRASAHSFSSSSPRAAAAGSSPRSGHRSPTTPTHFSTASASRAPLHSSAASPRSGGVSPKVSPPPSTMWSSNLPVTSSSGYTSPAHSSSPRTQYSTAPRPVSSGASSPWAASPPASRK